MSKNFNELATFKVEEEKAKRVAEEKFVVLRTARSDLAAFMTIISTAPVVEEQLRKLNRFPGLAHRSALSEQDRQYETLLTNFAIASQDYEDACRKLGTLQRSLDAKTGPK